MSSRPGSAKRSLALLDRRGIESARALSRKRRTTRTSSKLAERLIDWDERLMLWRTLHLKLVERVIGGDVIGTQGTPVEVLGKRLDVRYFPSLWDVRNALTDEAETSPRLTQLRTVEARRAAMSPGARTWPPVVRMIPAW